MKIDTAAWVKLTAEFSDLNLYRKKVEQLNEKMNGDTEHVAFRLALARVSTNRRYYSKINLVPDVLQPISRGAVALSRPISRGAAAVASRGASAMSVGGVCSKRNVGRNTASADIKEDSGKRVVNSKKFRLDNVESK